MGRPLPVAPTHGSILTETSRRTGRFLPPFEQLTGSIERVTFYNPQNGYSVIRLRPGRRKLPGMNRQGLLTVVGYLPALAPGEFLHLTGRWEKHPIHGLQFTIETCEQTLPASVEGIMLYLGSGLIKGIGPQLAERIVTRFGEHTFEVIEEQPALLSQVKDIGNKRKRQIVHAWQEQKHIKELMVYLHTQGLSTNLAVKIYKEYSDQSMQIVQTDPYRLARDIPGISFKAADKIASALGLPGNHPSRIEASLIYLLKTSMEDGHTYQLSSGLAEAASQLLNLSLSEITAGIARLDEMGLVFLDRKIITENSSDARVYLPEIYKAESLLAARFRQIITTSSQSKLKPVYSVSLLSDLKPTLSQEQLNAIETSLANPLSVLTGGPGTGKTATISALISLLEDRGIKYALCAPTGRAAKRLNEATGRPASTVHRLLEYNPGSGFQINSSNRLPIDVLVVDEASMLDLLLADSLFQAVSPGTHVLLVGDIDQLPSVGAGDVLGDLIRSGIVPVTRLHQIFRQSSGSHIIRNAHRINRGEMPLIEQTETDFYLFPASSAEEAAGWLVNIVAQRIPRKFGYNPTSDIQVIAPMYRGSSGVDALNARLQAVLNPASTNKVEHSFYGHILRIGDRVMQTENNYEKDVYNGDIGKIAGIQLEDQILILDFDGHQVEYTWKESDQLSLAYAISIHKAQGSEFPVVVIPIVNQHQPLLHRNLLYTAVSRARNLCVLVGDRQAIQTAVRRETTLDRLSGLLLRLRNS